jgi:hypothetical protein
MSPIHKSNSTIFHATIFADNFTTSFNKKLVAINSNTVFAINTIHGFLRLADYTITIGIVNGSLEKFFCVHSEFGVLNTKGENNEK